MFGKVNVLITYSQSSEVIAMFNESNSTSKALYLHIPKNDNKPISDLENITENNL